MGQDMGMTGILGIISLMGIIVRNGIIMVDYAEELRVEHRLSAKHAALQAAQRRMRPIFLTSAAASMGVVPMVLENTPMWGPMGVVVCFGTIISMFFIITMIPIGYWMVFRIEDRRRILKNEKRRAAISMAWVSAMTE
jgi:multidrug efflux pump